MSRPPDYAFYNGACFGHTTPWVGLNDLAVGIGTGVYAAPTDENCNFSSPMSRTATTSSPSGTRTST